MVNSNPPHQFILCDFNTLLPNNSLQIYFSDMKTRELLATLLIEPDDKVILNARNNAIAEEFLVAVERQLLTNTVLWGIEILYIPYDEKKGKKKSKMEKRRIRKKMAQQT